MSPLPACTGLVLGFGGFFVAPRSFRQAYWPARAIGVEIESSIADTVAIAASSRQDALRLIVGYQVEFEMLVQGYGVILCCMAGIR